MKRVYQAGTLLEAQLVADTLNSMGIVNHLFNAHAVGAMGELPYSEILPEVWIEDSAREGQAREMVIAMHAAPTPDKSCPYCDELNPGNFLSCWHCGSALAA